jgi:serine/threonine-protein kinase
MATDSTAGDELRPLRAALGDRYELLHELGRGGMATVYLARDLRHQREVAIKVLHAELSAVLGTDRFEREIELTARLQHPHILPLFDSGSAAGRLYYVMPFVGGETLRARLERERQLPVQDAVRLAREIAEALAYAHDRGIVHRDVKPENILLQPGASGDHALVADFGIALAVQQAAGERLTHTGLSIGTPQYMAPEQAMGERDLDARVDVYALGAVLYEMLAGEPPFTGPTAQAILARVLTEEPRPVATLRRSVPAHVESAVQTALEKLPADRFVSVTAFAVALTSPGSMVPMRARGDVVAKRRWRSILSLFAAVAIAAVAFLLGQRSPVRARSTADLAAPLVRFAIEPESGSMRLTPPAISPDGRTIVFAAESPSGPRLYARRIDELDAHPLAGTDDARRPFFSPDGASVGFVAGGAIRRVRLDGKEASTVAELPMGTFLTTACWSRTGEIWFGTQRGELFRLAAAGGVPRRVVPRDTSIAFLSADVLPDGRAALVTTVSRRDSARLAMGLLDVASGEIRTIGSGGAPRYAAGYLLYLGSTSVLYRRRFDLRRLEFSGAAEEVARDIRFDEGPAFDVSSGGTLVYGRSVDFTIANGRMAMFDRSGREVQTFASRAPWVPRFAPDGRRLAYGARAPGKEVSDIWITDLEASTTLRVTGKGRDNNDPVWSPDGRSLLYSSIRDGPSKVLMAQALAGGEERRLRNELTFDQWPSDWAPDGRAVLVTLSKQADLDIWVQPADGTAPRPYLDTPTSEAAARCSPDGRWVAYQSGESGRTEVFVQSFPVPGRKLLVSADGGANPVWGRDGRTLYYWQEGLLIAAALAEDASGSLVVRSRSPLFRTAYIAGIHANYDVSPDGSRFAIVIGRPLSNQVVVTTNVFPLPDTRSSASR